MKWVPARYRDLLSKSVGHAAVTPLPHVPASPLDMACVTEWPYFRRLGVLTSNGLFPLLHLMNNDLNWYGTRSGS
jgi:hypothetical protein